MNFKDEIEEIRYRRGITPQTDGKDSTQKAITGDTTLILGSEGNGRIVSDPASPLYTLGGDAHRNWMIHYAKDLSELMVILTKAFIIISKRPADKPVSEEEFKEYYNQVISLVGFLSIFRGHI